jgi:hypothetical protein
MYILSLLEVFDTLLLTSLNFLDVHLGMVHHAGLIGSKAYNFVCAAEVLVAGMGSTATKALHLFTVIQFLGGIIAITIKSVHCDAQKGGWTSN